MLSEVDPERLRGGDEVLLCLPDDAGGAVTVSGLRLLLVLDDGRNPFDRDTWLRLRDAVTPHQPTAKSDYPAAPVCGYCTLTPEARAGWDYEAKNGDPRHHLARIIFGESRGEPNDTKVGIGAVVLNRRDAKGYYLHKPIDGGDPIAGTVSATRPGGKQFDAYQHSKLWLDSDTAYPMLDPPGEWTSRDYRTSYCREFNDSVLAAWDATVDRGAQFGWDSSYQMFAVPPTKPTVDKNHALADMGPVNGGGKTHFYNRERERAVPGHGGA